MDNPLCRHIWKKLTVVWGVLLIVAAAEGGFAAEPSAPKGSSPLVPATQQPAQQTGQGQGSVPSAVTPSPTARLTDRILQELEQKRRIIDQREEEIRREETRLQELRNDIKKRVETLKALEKKVQKALEKVEAVKSERLNHLVRAYSAMSPDAAAQLVNTLDINLAVEILRNMKVRKAGAILAVVRPDRAARISEMLARSKEKP